MSTGGASAVRNTLFAIISRECQHFQDGIVFDSTNLSQIPPYGTCNYDGQPTSVTNTGNTTGGADFPKSAAFAACHQFIGGKTSITTSFGGESFDVVDLNDTVIPRQHYKGPRNFSGNIELWDGDIDLTLWQSLLFGDWDPAFLSSEDFADLRHFEIWVLVNPTDTNSRKALNLTAVNADKLVRLFNVTFPTHDVNWENPNKITVPFNFSLAKHWGNWSQPTQATLLNIPNITTNTLFAGDATTGIQQTTVTGSSNIDFVATGSPDEIQSSGSVDWVTQGVLVGSDIIVGGTTLNNGTYTVVGFATTTTTNDTIQLADGSIVAEAGTSATITFPVAGSTNKVWTRLELDIAGATVANNSIITVTGSDPMGNSIEEPIDVGTSPGAAFKRATKATFYGTFSVEFDAGFTVAGTCAVKDIDYGLTPTLDTPGGIPVTN